MPLELEGFERYGLMIKFSLNIPKIGYIMVVKRADQDFFGSKIEKIQLLNGYKPKDACYTHAEILSGGPDSVRIMPPRAKLIDIQKFYKGRYVKIMSLDAEGFEYKYRYKIAVLYNTLCNKKYDKWGILSFILSFIPQDPRKPFCSEGVVESIRMVYDWFLVDMDASRVFPATLSAHPSLITRWEGRIPRII